MENARLHRAGFALKISVLDLSINIILLRMFVNAPAFVPNVINPLSCRAYSAAWKGDLKIAYE